MVFWHVYVTTMVSYLPTEIWHQIACYLTEAKIFELKCLNSFFLNYWMNLEWKEVVIDGSRSDLLVRIVYVHKKYIFFFWVLSTQRPLCCDEDKRPEDLPLPSTIHPDLGFLGINWPPSTLRCPLSVSLPCSLSESKIPQYFNLWENITIFSQISQLPPSHPQPNLTASFFGFSRLTWRSWGRGVSGCMAHRLGPPSWHSLSLPPITRRIPLLVPSWLIRLPDPPKTRLTHSVFT